MTTNPTDDEIKKRWNDITLSIGGDCWSASRDEFMQGAAIRLYHKAYEEGVAKTLTQVMTPVEAIKQAEQRGFEKGQQQPRTFSEQDVEKVAEELYGIDCIHYESMHGDCWQKAIRRMQETKLDADKEQRIKNLNEYRKKAHSLLQSLNLKSEAKIRADERRKCLDQCKHEQNSLERAWEERLYKVKQEAYAKGKADGHKETCTLQSHDKWMRKQFAEQYAKGQADLIEKLTSDAVESEMQLQFREVQYPMTIIHAAIKTCLEPAGSKTHPSVSRKSEAGEKLG